MGCNPNGFQSDFLFLVIFSFQLASTSPLNIKKGDFKRSTMALLRMNVRITEDYKAFVILLQGLCNSITDAL